MNADQIWRAGQRAAGAIDDRRRPTPGIAAVLVALAVEDEPTHGGAVARAAGQDQGNTSRWLHKLARYGFVEAVERLSANEVKHGKRPDGGRQSGGRPAVTWTLTALGWELVAALRTELAVAS